jgi:hypothetical protein
MQKVSVSVARAALWQATRKPASALSLAVPAILVVRPAAPPGGDGAG